MKDQQASMFSGLGVDTHKVVTAGTFILFVSTTVIQPSGLVITLAQSGSTTVSFTTPPTSELQENITIQGSFNCAAGDLITATFSSTAAIDQPPNKIQSTVNLRRLS